MLQKSRFALALLLALIISFAQAETSPSEVKLSIPNMVCVSCEMVIEEAIFQLTGVTGIEFDGEAKTALIRFDQALTSVDAILVASEEAGYPATVL